MQTDVGNLSDPRPAAPYMLREDMVDRSSRVSDSSVPSMVEDHGSDSSVDDSQYYRTSCEQIWDTFWQSGCEETEPWTSPDWQYPALVTPALGHETKKVLEDRKQHIKPHRLEMTTAPTHAPSRSEGDAQACSRRRPLPTHKVSYSIFPPQAERSSQKAIRTRRIPPPLPLNAPKARMSSELSPMSSLRTSSSARNLRSGSASSAFSASSGFSVSTTSTSSDHTVITTPATSPRSSWDCPNTPAPPTHVGQCLEPRTISKQPSLPNLSGSLRRRPVGTRSITAHHLVEGEARTSFTVAEAAAEEPYPRPLFTPPPTVPARRAPLPPVSQRLPPPVSTTRPIPRPALSRPLPPLPLDVTRSSTPSSIPPRRPVRPENQRAATNFGPVLSPPRPSPFRAISLPQQANQDFQPAVVSIFEWDSESDSDAEEEPHSFAKRIARGFARVRDHREHPHPHPPPPPHHVRNAEGAGAKGQRRVGGSEDLTRLRSGDTVTQEQYAAAAVEKGRARALTVQDVRRVEADLDRLVIEREPVAKERPGMRKQKSIIFGRMLGRRN